MVQALGKVRDDAIDAEVDHPAQRFLVVDGPDREGETPRATAGRDLRREQIVLDGKLPRARPEGRFDGVLLERLDQQRGRHIGGELFHLLDRARAEGLYDDPFLEVIAPYEVHDLRLEVGRV